MARENRGIIAEVRRHASRALALLNAEIRRTEAQLEEMLEQARRWRDAVTGAGASAATKPRRGRPPGKGRRATPGRRRSGGGRVDWDQVLQSMPPQFGVADVLRHPGARAKGRAQVYPSLTRWAQAKKIRTLEKGRYQRL